MSLSFYAPSVSVFFLNFDKRPLKFLVSFLINALSVYSRKYSTISRFAFWQVNHVQEKFKNMFV